MRSSVVPILALFLALMNVQHTRAQVGPLQPGDHVAYIGNTLADRMQHDGWLETYIQALLPKHQLTFRNLGFSGDEVKLRQRADNFGDPDQWLTKCQADVVLCFFGYNEALKGEAGLVEFSRDLTEMLGHMKRQAYNGSTPPKIIVFSPIAHEDLKSPHLPDGSVNNKHLAMYTESMRKVCAGAEVEFVDLFAISQQLYADADQPLTMNGIHLLDHGNRALAQAIIKHFAPNVKIPSDADVAKLREAVLDKNLQWFSRYRVVDEYNVFGGRSKLAWFGQSNADVMMREMEIFDVKAANRDQRIWAIAQGGDLEVKDDNLPPLLAVKPNKEGPLPGGAFPYLDGEEAIEKMQVGEGLQVNLFASEKQFPRLINPVQMAVDSDSRLWASVWPSYPHWNPTQPRMDALVILPDEDNDGKADELIVFADELNSITGFEFWGGGVLVAAPPEIWFLKDTDGDDKADQKIRVLQGLSSADTHHSANAMVVGPDGWLCWSRGIFNVAAFETPTQTYRSGNSGVHRFNPRTFEVDFLYPIGPNPHGDVIDQWGFQFANDGTSGTGGYVSIGKGQRPGNRQWFKKEWRPVAATGILSSSHFPDEFQNDFLICNTIGFLGVLRYDVQTNGAEITAERTEDILQSSDPNFRPVDIEVGGDGALYIADWHNTLIGHMQHNMRDPNRDHAHGRIYRVSAQGRATLQPPKMKGRPIAEVLANFFAKENSVRYHARLELSGRDSAAVADAVASFTAALDPAQADADRNEAQALLECLWVHEEHRLPTLSLLEKTFQAREPRVRAAAIRTLGHWAGRVDDWQPILAAAATDESALVRAEAAKAAVEFEGLPAMEVIFEVATRDTDPELDDVLAYARSQIKVDQMIKEAIAARKKLSPAAKAYALQNADAKLLLQMEKSSEVYDALLARENISADNRWQAIEALAQSAGRSKLEQLVSTIAKAESGDFASLEDLATMLAKLDADQLNGAGATLKQLVEQSKSSIVRPAIYAAWFRSGEIEPAWKHAMKSRVSLSDALSGLQAIDDKRGVDKLFALVRPLMFELPAGLQSADDTVASTAGPPVAYEYYAPNPAQDVAMETLDRASPTAIGVMEGFATFVPDGRKDEFATRQTASLVIPKAGRYTFYTSSDDGSRLYIDNKLVVDNDGLHGMREIAGKLRLDAGLHEISVTYFDNGGGDGLIVSWQGPGLAKQPIAADFLRPSGSGNLRQQSLAVLAAWPGHTADKISDFSRLVSQDSLAVSALNALANLPGKQVADKLSESEAEPILARLFEQADQASPAERQSAEFSKWLALGSNLLRKSEAAGKRTTRDGASRKLADLKASIPVKADEKVMELGREVYARESHCATCHQPHGQGLPNLYPPLDGSQWVTGSEERLIRMVLDGMHGTIEVKGKRYSSPPLPPMTGFRHLLTDQEVAAALTYVRNSWTNRAKPVAAQTVAAMRAIDRGNDAAFWSANELLRQYPLEDGTLPIDDGTPDGWIPKLVKEWKLSDFSKTKLEAGGRSYASGQAAFNKIGCAQCHKLGASGGVFGPNLAELDAKKRNADYVLQSILDPSKDVEEKYAMRTYLIDSGQVISGFVVKETDTEIHLKSDPLNQQEGTVIVKAEIETQSTNAKSIMPMGLLNWLNEDEVLDLIAYVLAAGDERHPLFAK